MLPAWLQVVPLPLAEQAALPTPFWGLVQAAWHHGCCQAPEAVEMRQLPFQAFCSRLPEG